MMRSRGAMWGLLAVVSFVTGLVVACGGGSSSTSGPSGGGGGGSTGAVVQGQLSRGASAIGEPTVVLALRTVLGVGLAEAQPGTPVPDGTEVTLTPLGGGPVLTTETTGGAFIFSNVLPGDYTLAVEGFNIIQGPTTIFVGTGDLANVTGTVVQQGAIQTNVAVTAGTTDPDLIIESPGQVGHVINASKKAGVPPDTVWALRLQGLGWGQICHSLGIHPSSIGLGHEPSQAEVEGFKASKGKGKGKGKKKGQA